MTNPPAVIQVPYQHLTAALAMVGGAQQAAQAGKAMLEMHAGQSIPIPDAALAILAEIDKGTPMTITLEIGCLAYRVEVR